MQFVDLGLMELPEALLYQEKAVISIANREGPETIYFLEHPHVFTTGRLVKKNFPVKDSWSRNSVRTISVNRGGGITYHGPGQLMGYVHLDLRRRRKDVRSFLRDLELSLILAVKKVGINAYRKPGLTGVWSDEGKLASIGVGVRRWITMHGFALNIQTDLRYFQLINPCGFPNCPMTSLNQMLKRSVSMDEIKKLFRDSCREVFAD